MTDNYNIGTVVRAKWFETRRIFVNVGPERWATYRTEFVKPQVDLTNERCLEEIEVLHDGFKQETAEPKNFGAQIINFLGRRYVRTADGDRERYPWRSDCGSALEWSELAQPVIVINDGSIW